jgi:FkbM family methyltransferase
MLSPRVNALFLLSALLRKAPRFRGKGRLAALLNRPLLKALSSTDAVRWVRMRDGSYMKVDLRSATEWRCFYTGEYDGYVASILPLITQNSSVIDVGANIGFWTVPLARHIQHLGGVCYGFEPVPANFERLRQNVDRNALQNVVQLYPLALGEKNDEITMMVDTSEGALTGNAARVPHAAFDDGQRERTPVSVKLRRLDDIASEIGLEQHPCAFMKLDIEGCEPFFLRGAAGFIQQHQPAILMEINRPWLTRNGLGIEDYLDVLSPRKYRMFVLCEHFWSEVAEPGLVRELHEIETAMFVPRSMQNLNVSSLRS